MFETNALASILEFTRFKNLVLAKSRFLVKRKGQQKRWGIGKKVRGGQRFTLRSFSFPTSYHIGTISTYPHLGMFLFEPRLICKLIKQFVTLGGSLTLPPFHLSLVYALRKYIAQPGLSNRFVLFNEIPNNLLIS